MDLELPRKPTKPTWAQFTFPQRPRFKPRPCHDPQFEGWDTETTPTHPVGAWKGKPGHAFILANSQTATTLQDPHDLANAVSWLARAGRGRINAWWNLDFDVRCLFKWDLDVAQALYPEQNAEGQATVHGHKIRYLREKILTIKSPGGHVSRHYDANNFYQSSLAKSAKKFLGREAPDLKQHRDEDLTLKPREEVKSYSMWDATATRDLMALFITKLHGLGFYPRRPISAGFLCQEFLLQTTNVPTWRDVPNQVNRAAWEAFRGGWIDLYQRGRVKVWKYDLNAAYPWAMMQLPDLRRGSWRQELDLASPLGFVKARIHQEPGTPTAIAGWMGASHAYPLLDGPTRTWITIQEYKALSRIPGIHVEPLQAWTWRARGHVEHPFQKPLAKLLTYKKANDPRTGGDVGAYTAAKFLVNSGYGKTVERVRQGVEWRAGRIFCPVYAATTTAMVRCLILDAIRNHLDHVVAISTDSLASTKPLPIPLDEDTPGKWKTEARNAEGIFAFPGVYEVDGERAHHRGFRITGSLRESLAGANGVLKITYTRPTGAREAIRAKDPGRMGVFEERSYDKELYSDRRLWIQRPATFRSLLRYAYRSVPVPLSLVHTAWHDRRGGCWNGPSCPGPLDPG